MKIKKIVAGLSAAVLAATMMSVSVSQQNLAMLFIRQRRTQK